MNYLIVPKPLFTSEMEARGYIMSAQYGNALIELARSNPLDRSMNSLFIDFIKDVGLTALTQDKMVFIPVTNIHLMTNLEEDLNEEYENIVFVLDEYVEVNDLVLDRIARFCKLRFKFAVTYIGNIDSLRPFIPYTDYIVVKIPAEYLRVHAKELSRQFPRITTIAPEIHDKLVFDTIKHNTTHLFGGPFYKVHITKSSKKTALSPLRVNYISLLNIVNNKDFDFDNFTNTIRQDPALAMQFMKLINNTGRTRSEIKNLNQAAAMLGQVEIKKWVSTAVSNALCSDNPSEVMRTSLIRARFCENLAEHFELEINADNLFVMGLFSTLDIVLEMPIEEALMLVFVPAKIHDALAYGTGEYAEVLNFIKEYEFGNWHEISRLALLKNITISDIHIAYKSALLWYDELIHHEVDIEEV